MKTVIAYLFCAVVVEANPMVGRTPVDPAYLDSTVLDGTAPRLEEHNYVASVQLNSSHICSSGMFQMGFLLITAECAWHLGMAVKKGDLRASAVFADPRLKNGQRINIKKIAYSFRYDIYENDVGVIMLVNNIIRTHMSFLHLYPSNMNLRRNGPHASVCGWVTDDPIDNIEFEKSKFFGKLHCKSMKLYGESACYKNIPFGDYKNKLVCGTSDSPKKTATVQDLGSPLTKIVHNDYGDERVILGITILPHVHENFTFHRFIKISFVFNDIQAMVEKIESETGADKSCINNYQYLIGKSNKRQK